MSTSPYNALYLDGRPVDLTEVPDIPISYKLEDRFDPQNKTSAEALSIQLPATLNNSQLSNDFSNPSVEDLTADQAFKNARQVTYESQGNTIFHGKALLKEAKHTSRPTSYTYDMFGDNANWVIPLKDVTLYDFVRHIQLTFDTASVRSSWAFDGTDEALPFVFAPVRYGAAMDDYSILTTGGVTKTFTDYNMVTSYMKPALSKYWIIYWALKSQGFRIQSTFADTQYFRRQVMPWTWGGFARLNESRFDILKFMAAGTEKVTLSNVNRNAFIDVKASDDVNNGNYDNAGTPGVYTYNATTGALTWTYPTAYQYGAIEAHFQLDFDINAMAAGAVAGIGGFNGTASMKVEFYWQKNGADIRPPVVVVDLKSAGNLSAVNNPNASYNLIANVSPGDVVTGRFHVSSTVDTKSQNSLQIQIISFQIAYFQNAQNSTIDFANFTAFKNYKWLDFLAGIIDEFDLSINTDPINKVVYIEPTHAYSLTSSPILTTPGYFNGDFLNWEDRQDLAKEHTLELFSDENRNQVFSYKDDSSDGMLKVVQDRHSIALGQGKYILPERFKTDKTSTENRFFSPTMHYNVDQWKTFTGTVPQMVVMAPENISNSSADEADNTFAPKSCYYKGIVTGVSWVFNGSTESGFPFMFAVNYMPGGENDPILSYSDERIGVDGAYVVGMGLLRRFYLNRLAIMRNGQYYSPAYLRLNNNDVSNVLHREFKLINGQPWELIEITGYRADQSTECHLRKWVPLGQEDAAAVFPSQASVLGTVSSAAGDTKYNPLVCLHSDIK